MYIVVSLKCTKPILLFHVTAEQQVRELDRHEVNVVIATLQNDYDRDVRHLVSRLPGITSANDDTVCVANVAICFHLLVTSLSAGKSFTV